MKQPALPTVPEWYTAQELRDLCPWLPAFTWQELQWTSDDEGETVLDRDSENAKFCKATCCDYAAIAWSELAKDMPGVIAGFKHPLGTFGRCSEDEVDPLFVDNDNDYISKF